MNVSRTTGTQPLLLFATIAAAGLAVIVAAIFFFPLSIDEAYITYSHARNFARSGRLVYHPANPEFSVGSPLYALLLGLGGAAGLPYSRVQQVPGSGQHFRFERLPVFALPPQRDDLGRDYCRPTAGHVSFVVGRHSAWRPSFFLLLVLAALYHFDRGHYVAVGLLTALAVLTRAEGALFAGVLVFFHFLQVALRRELSFMAIATSLAEAAVALLFHVESVSSLCGGGVSVGRGRGPGGRGRITVFHCRYIRQKGEYPWERAAGPLPACCRRDRLPSGTGSGPSLAC